MLTSAYAYQALTLYCSKDAVSLPGFAKYFYKEALQQQHVFFQIAAFMVCCVAAVENASIMMPSHLGDT